jgi:uncharacterized membrane protein
LLTALQTPTSAQNAQQHIPPLVTALTVTSTASMEGTLLGHLVPAPALPATLALAVLTVKSAQQATVGLTAPLMPAKLLLLLLMLGLMVTSTASMGGILAALQDLAPALLATLGFGV